MILKEIKNIKTQQVLLKQVYLKTSLNLFLNLFLNKLETCCAFIFN